jgi:periplasmic protein TonB
LLSKLNVNPIKPSLIKSIAIHLLLVLLFGLMSLTEKGQEKTVLEFSVIENVKVAPEMKTAPIVNIEKPLPPPPPKTTRQVFGLSRKSVTAQTGVEVKQGNTVAKTPDDLKLNDDDDDKIPIPADEFLITAMPKVMEEIRPTYPASAKKEGIEGRVIFEIIIDEKGQVRKADLIQSLGEEFDQAAKEAIMRFRFRPAMMDKQAVAVKIKYAINFKLER